MFLKIPAVRNYFNIEEKKKVEKPKSKKGIIRDFKDCKTFTRYLKI